MKTKAKEILATILSTALALSAFPVLAQEGPGAVAAGRSDIPDTVIPFSPVTQGRLDYRNYIYSGMTHMWDAENNSGFGEYNPDATVWVDLVGDIDLSMPQTAAGKIVEHSWNGKYTRTIYFTNSQGWSTGSSENYTVSSRGFCEVVFRMNDSVNTVASVQGIISIGRDTVSKVAQAGVRQGTLQVGNRSDRCTDISKTYNDIHTVSFGIYYATDPWYVDGIPGTVSGTTFSNGSNRGIHVGSFWNGANVDIFCVRVYSKVLTAAEVAANYQVDRERFGIE